MVVPEVQERKPAACRLFTKLRQKQPAKDKNKSKGGMRASLQNPLEDTLHVEEIKSYKSLHASSSDSGYKSNRSEKQKKLVGANRPRGGSRTCEMRSRVSFEG